MQAAEPCAVPHTSATPPEPAAKEAKPNSEGAEAIPEAASKEQKAPVAEVPEASGRECLLIVISPPLRTNAEIGMKNIIELLHELG